jgi:hypothetical protein
MHPLVTAAEPRDLMTTLEVLWSCNPTDRFETPGSVPDVLAVSAGHADGRSLGPPALRSRSITSRR